MDRNSITGIVLIMGMLLGYQYFFAPKEELVVTPKVSALKAVVAVKKETTKATIDSSAKPEQVFTLENKDIVVKISSKGAKLVSVQLKNYKSFATFDAGKKDGLYLYNAASDEFSIVLPTSAGKINVSTLDLSLIHI